MTQKFLTFKHKIGLGVVVVLFYLNIFAWQHVFVLAAPHHLRVDALNIGQGDSIFIQTPSFRHILIDGGPDSTVLERLAEQLPFWQRSLDVVVLTHPDADHLMGLLEVLKKYKVNYIVWTGIERDGVNYQAWRQLLARKQKEGTEIIIAKAGLSLESAGANLLVLHPFESLEGAVFNKEGNDTGIVSRLAYGATSFLFTADVSSAVEQGLISKAALASDVLKVGHHGSKHSSSIEFLRAVNPKNAVISVGAHNSYGHPTPEVLQRLQEFGINTQRTDRDGTVKFISNGNTIIKK